jgi:exodeoxyribonuclease VII large subunit
MRDRHATELAADLRHALRAGLDARARRHRTLSATLDTFDLRHRLAALRGRLTAARTGLETGVTSRRLRLDARLGGAVARLESLSPLAVLGRGYAVCFTGDRSAVLRSADQVRPGDPVRVKLHEGELQCDVRAIMSDDQ